MSRNKRQVELWTACQFLASLEPCRMRQPKNSNSAMADLLLHAHVIAVLSGEGWNPHNEYTLGVWVTAYQS